MGPTGLQGPIGPEGPAGGPPGPTGPAGPPGSGNDLLFTRATTTFGDTVANKDALCVAELGPAFRAASTYNIASLHKTEISVVGATAGAFTVSNYTAALITVGISSGTANFGSLAGAAGPVACARLAAPLQFTRAFAGFGDTLAAKDALCVTEFGATYRTASSPDVAAQYRSVFAMFFSGPGAFTTTAVTGLLTVSTRGTNALLPSSAGATGAVACPSM